MSKLQLIKSIVDQAHQEWWPYPKQFDALKMIGVTGYTVDVTKVDRSYNTYEGSYTLPIPGNYSPTTAAPLYDETAFLDALHQRIQKKLTYSEFLHAIAVAGIATYKVDMDKRTVTYCDIHGGSAHVQNVPVFEQ